MKKIFKHTLAVFLIAIMMFGTTPLSELVGIDLSIIDDLFTTKTSAATITSYSQGDIIEFGWYPQSKVTDEAVISALNSSGGEWISYNYYSGTGDYQDGNMRSSDFMRYKDVIYKSYKYRGVVFDYYRPSYTGYELSSKSTYQDDNGYSTGTVYWFKYEPIKWRVLDPTTGMVMAETILDSQPYNNYANFSNSYYWGDSSKKYYANNYEKSSIREWLNNDFYNTAFSSSQQDIIEYTTLSNSAHSSHIFDSASTTDKIYLLSYNDVVNTNYNFSNSTGYDTIRESQGSDYAKCQGLSVCSDNTNYIGNSSWRLRSAGNRSDCTCTVDIYGSLEDYYGKAAYYTYIGIRPALNFNLSSEILQSNVNNGGSSTGGASTESIYNLGEETYSFCNFGDSDSLGGHCFGMSMTSSAYYIGKLDTNKVGVSDAQYVNTLPLTSAVKEPICKYQAIQGSYSANATVAGGSFYLTSKYDINSDWNEVLNYVKNHNYDNKGALQIGFRKNGEGGHAINFLRYEEVDGQPRIYAYDNNFPTAETYFYKDTNGKIKQAPYSTFSGSIDCIALRDVSTYFSKADNFDTTRYIYADRNEIAVNGVSVYPLDGDITKGERVVFEIPANVEQVTITPLVNNAEFTYINEEYTFGNVDDDTVGIFKLATTDDSSQASGMTIVNKDDITNIVIKAPTTTTISYGDSIILHAELTQTLPNGWSIKWEDSNGKFSLNTSADGTNCTISPSSNGNTTITVTIYDANGNVISSDELVMTAKAGFFDKIIAFFKKLFGLTKTIPQVSKV